MAPTMTPAMLEKLLGFAEETMKSGYDLSFLERDLLSILCQARGIKPVSTSPYTSDYRHVSKMLSRDYEDRHVYDHLDRAVLRQFVIQRGLRSRSDKVPDSVAALEEADRDRRFRFMELPPELRVQVCRYVFSDSTFAERSQVDATESGYVGYGYGPRDGHALLRVSRLVRAESRSLFHGVRRFWMDEEIRDLGRTTYTDSNGKRERTVRRLESMLMHSLRPKARSYAMKIPSVMHNGRRQCAALLHVNFSPGSPLPSVEVIPEFANAVWRQPGRQNVKVMLQWLEHYLKTLGTGENHYAAAKIQKLLGHAKQAWKVV